MLDILWQDEHLIAIDKPPGLLVHRSDLDRHETRFAVQLLRDQIGRRVTPVHRLDKGTSGVLLFAYAADMVRALAQQFDAGTVDKTYLAVTRGWPPDSGSIDHPLLRKHDDYGRPLPSGTAQTALTHFRRLASIELPISVERYPTSRYALVELHPISGRRHQLRRHLKHIGHPIIGDATHGKGIHNRFFQQHFDCHRLLLACTRLLFTHPVTGQKVDIDKTANDPFSQCSGLLAQFIRSQRNAPCPAARPLAIQAVSR